MIKVSFTGAPEYMDRNVGFGEASFHMFNELQKNDIECLIGDPSTKISISFITPDQYMFGKKQYKIGYSPWESTGIKPTWINGLKQIDELWVPSEWNAELFKQYTNKPIMVYKHGIQDDWVPKKRSVDTSRPFRFLHIGEPAFRKGGQMTVDAFTDVFGNDKNYELILKCTRMNTARAFDKRTGRVLGSPDAHYKNIKVIEAMLSKEQMNGLYDLCDAFVYPSMGEGFGFNPLQAMAKGMPTICTSEWATYKDYITMPLDSTLIESPWQEIHPGALFKPNYNQLRDYMKDVAENYETYSDIAYKNAFLIHKEYNWEKVTKPAVKRIKEIQEF